MEFFKTPFLVLYFSDYRVVNFLIMSFVIMERCIAIYTVDTTL